MSQNAASPRFAPPLWGVVVPWAAIVAVYLAQVWRQRGFVVDDAGISFAYAKQIATGNGYVLWPAGERVEGATNLLWVWLHVPAFWLKVSPVLWSKILGTACGVVALTLVAAAPRWLRTVKTPDGIRGVVAQPLTWWSLMDFAGALLLAAVPGFALWSVSGLENGLFGALAAALLVQTIVSTTSASTAERWPVSALLGALLFCTRPDGILYVVLVFVFKLFRAIPRLQDPSVTSEQRQARWRDVVQFTLALAILLGAVTAGRVAYFGWPLPNSYYCKERTFHFGAGLLQLRGFGWQYVARFVSSHVFLLLAALPMLVLRARGRTSIDWLLLGAGTIALLFPVYAGGDWMEEWRFCTLGLPVLCIALQHALARVIKEQRRAIQLLVATLVIAQAVTILALRLPATRSHHTLTLGEVSTRAARLANLSDELGLVGSSLLDPDIGGSSLDGRLRIIDLYGLSDIAITRQHPRYEAGFRAYVFREVKPTFIHLHGAWFDDTSFNQLEELHQLYLPLPDNPVGSLEMIRREAFAAPWFAEAEDIEASSGVKDGAVVDGITITGGQTGQPLKVRLSVKVPLRGELPHSISLSLRILGKPELVHALNLPSRLFQRAMFLPGERLRVQTTFIPNESGKAGMWATIDGREALLRTFDISPHHSLPLDSNNPRAMLACELGAVCPEWARRLEWMGAHIAPVFPEEGASLLVRSRELGQPNSVGLSVARQLVVAAEKADDEGSLGMARAVLALEPTAAHTRKSLEERRFRATAHFDPSQRYDGAIDAMAYRAAAHAVTFPGSAPLAIAWLSEAHRPLEAYRFWRSEMPLTPAERCLLLRGSWLAGDEVAAEFLRPGQTLTPCPMTSRVDVVGGEDFERSDRYDTTGSMRRCTGPKSYAVGAQGHSWMSSIGGSKPGAGQGQWTFRHHIQSDTLSFLLAGSRGGRAGVRLRVDGNITHFAKGLGDEVLRRTFWNVATYRDKDVLLEAFDESDEEFVSIDDIRPLPKMPPP